MMKKEKMKLIPTLPANPFQVHKVTIATTVASILLIQCSNYEEKRREEKRNEPN